MGSYYLKSKIVIFDSERNDNNITIVIIIIL